MTERDVYLKIETIPGYSPAEPDDHTTPPIEYRRDCMRNPGHEDGSIPADEVEARRLTALVYREYLDPGYLVPKPDKLVLTDVNEPAFNRRVPGTVIYTSPGERLRIHVKNADVRPHSLHVHGLSYGIDSDGAWPLGTQASDGRRSDEICPGQSWTYTFDVGEESIGAWPFHDHHRNIGDQINRGLFGGIVVLPTAEECDTLPRFPLPNGLSDLLADDLATVPGPSSAGGLTAEPPPAGSAGARHAQGMDLSNMPEELVPQLAALDELAHGATTRLLPAEQTLQVPLFFHQMSGTRSTPVFQSAPTNPGGAFTSPVFTIPATYHYICGIHGAVMSGTVQVQAGGPATAAVTMQDFQFVPPVVTVGVGGQVIWTNNGPSQHSVVETGGDTLASLCFNGRSFVGNTPTVLAHAGQRIRWSVFNLDLSMGWHNFHPHAQRWNFARQQVDVRSIGPAESFTVETEAPPVLLLPPDIAATQDPDDRPDDAVEVALRGDFLVHCHVEPHMMAGLAALVRSHQAVWLTPAQQNQLLATVGLPLDPGDNACPTIDLARCATASSGRWDEVPGLPQVTMMHAVLLAGSNRVLFWGYGPRADQSRVWDADTGAYTQPVNQPQALTADENIWSTSHAYLDDPGGTILVAGGFRSDKNNPVLTVNTERRAFTFDPTTLHWSTATDLHADRFYPTSITLADGRVLTLYGQDTTTGATTSSLEVFTPGGAGAWAGLTPLPFNYFYYPWTFLLPDGQLFIAGPQKPARKVDWTTTPIPDPPTAQFPQTAPQRGTNMDGTAVLLPLKPPNYPPRVLIAGGDSPATGQSAEWIDLSAPAPVWQALPNLNVPRDKLNSVLLPDGRVFIAGGILTLPDGGPAEIFDPDDPQSGFALGPAMRHQRGYHSSAILLPDGSVLMGGDTNGGADGANIPNERYLPSYFFKPRPTITTAPATLTHDAAFTVQSPQAGAISEVILLRPGAVTHAFNQAQRYVGCPITGRTATDVQATAPPDGNLAPPGHYLLFLLDTDRTPSTGTWIRLS